MATGYQFHKIKNFQKLNLIKIGDTWKSTYQRAIPGLEQDPPSSEVAYIGESSDTNFHKYAVKHETIRSIKVRWQNEIYRRVIAVQDFNLYIPKNYTYLYASTKARFCKELLERIQNDKPVFEYTTRIVDLAGIKSHFLDEVRGGWFKDLSIADVSAAGIFGATVGGSDEFSRFEKSGRLSVLSLELSFPIGKLSLQITREGTIVLYENFQEGELLYLLERINDEIMKFAEEETTN